MDNNNKYKLVKKAGKKISLSEWMKAIYQDIKMVALNEKKNINKIALVYKRTGARRNIYTSNNNTKSCIITSRMRTNLHTFYLSL